MSGDYTRFTDRPRSRYSGVLMQQGRVQLDADWNEEIDILERRWEVQALDTFGPCAVPAATTPDGFAVGAMAGGDLPLGAGRIYVDGLLAEIFPAEPGETAVSYLHQPFLPTPPPLPAGDAIVYLDVWQREVTWVEDAKLLEIALGGVDTAARRQTVWQVKIAPPPPLDSAACGVDLGALLPPSSARLSSRAVAPPASDDPCILSPTGGYRGLENRLYRVEVHDGASVATARLKWSRENASVVSPVTQIDLAGALSRLTVTRIGRDNVLRFKIDDWVEVTDDLRELMGEPGEMAQVTAIDEANVTITLDRTIAGGRPFGANSLELRGRHTRLRRWDQRLGVDADGLVAASLAWLPLEDGVEVRFAAALPPASDTTLRTGDFWAFAARTVDGSVEELADAPPRGIAHHYGQLAAIAGGKVHDCRKLWPAQGRCCCCTVEVGDGQTSHGDFDDLLTAIAALAATPAATPNSPGTPAADTPIEICLLPGVHTLRDTAVLAQSRLTIRGCGRAAQVTGPAGKPAFLLTGSYAALEHIYLVSPSPELPAVACVGLEGRVTGCEIETGGGPAVLSVATRKLRVAGNRLSGASAFLKPGAAVPGSALIVLERSTRSARIAGNLIGPCPGHGIGLAIASQVDVVIAGNDISAAMGSGIASIPRLDLGWLIELLSASTGEVPPRDMAAEYKIVAVYQVDETVSRRYKFLPAPNRVNGLRIEANTILDCARRAAPSEKALLPMGGIVLARVAHLEIAANHVENNGIGGRAPIAGIYVFDCQGLIVRDNVVTGNGPDAAAPVVAGPQGGIVGADLSVIVDAVDLNPDPAQQDPQLVPMQPDGWPAAAIQGNLVVAPRGPALSLIGMGPMLVTGNRFTARDVVPAPQLQDLASFAGAVLILNHGMPAYAVSQFLAAGFQTDTAAPPVDGSLDIWSVSGKVQFADNQVTLDLVRGKVEAALAASLIVTLDDLAFQDNQTECTLLRRDFLAVDTLAMAITARATGNGLTESFASVYLSLWMVGLWMCTVMGNQATHCIVAECLTAKKVDQANLTFLCDPKLSQVQVLAKGA